jgi:hypothetical protein
MAARKMNLKLPLGLAVGMRIATNKRYNVCYPRVARVRNGVPRTGTIMAGTMRCGDGAVMVLLDDQRHSHPLELKLFDVIEA